MKNLVNVFTICIGLLATPTLFADTSIDTRVSHERFQRDPVRNEAFQSREKKLSSQYRINKIKFEKRKANWSSRSVDRPF